jgi:hypothetical protein
MLGSNNHVLEEAAAQTHSCWLEAIVCVIQTAYSMLRVIQTAYSMLRVIQTAYSMSAFTLSPYQPPEFEGIWAWHHSVGYSNHELCHIPLNELNVFGHGITAGLQLGVLCADHELCHHTDDVARHCRYLGMAPLYSETLWDEVAAKQQAELLPSAKLLRSAGMTAVTGGINGPVFNGYAANGTMLLNFSGFDQAMEVVRHPSVPSLFWFVAANVVNVMPDLALHDHIFTIHIGLHLLPHGLQATSVFPGVPVNSYGGLSIEGVASSADMTAVAKAVAVHIKAKGWPNVYESIGDEPDGANVDSSDAAAAAIANAGDTNFKSAAFTSFLTSANPHAELTNHTSLIVLNECGTCLKSAMF